MCYQCCPLCTTIPLPCLGNTRSCLLCCDDPDTCARHRLRELLAEALLWVAECIQGPRGIMPGVRHTWKNRMELNSPGGRKRVALRRPSLTEILFTPSPKNHRSLVHFPSKWFVSPWPSYTSKSTQKGVRTFLFASRL